MLRENRKILLDKLYRKNFIKNELKFVLLKSIFQNRQVQSNLRFYAKILISNHQKRYFISKQKKKCIISGNSKGILSKFEINRHVIKKFNNMGLIQNVTTRKW